MALSIVLPDAEPRALGGRAPESESAGRDARSERPLREALQPATWLLRPPLRSDATGATWWSKMSSTGAGALRRPQPRPRWALRHADRMALEQLHRGDRRRHRTAVPRRRTDTAAFRGALTCTTSSKTGSAERTGRSALAPADMSKCLAPGHVQTGEGCQRGAAGAALRARWPARVRRRRRRAPPRAPARCDPPGRSASARVLREAAPRGRARSLAAAPRSKGRPLRSEHLVAHAADRSTWPVSVISPVIATSSETVRPDTSETIAVAIVTPATARLRDSSCRDMDMHVVRLEPRRVEAEHRRMRSAPRRARPARTPA